MTRNKPIPLPRENSPGVTVVLADGEYPSEGTIAARILAGAVRVVCCDGAADAFITHGGEPAAIVGDCDSISEAARTKFGDRIFASADQETNDLTKAVRYCVGQGWDRIVILGATGRREDHTIANVSLLVDYAAVADVCMVSNYGVFDPILESASFETRPGQQVSIFTIDTTTDIRVEGLLYTPPRHGLCGWWRGSLNEAAGDEFTIHTDGPAIIFRALDE